MRTFISFLLCAAALFAGDQAGRRAPGFALPDSTMKFHDLADYRGKIVLIWNSCRPIAPTAPNSPAS